MRLQTPSQLTRQWTFAAAMFAFAAAAMPTSAWEPGTSPLKTRWARNVTPENTHPEYPRPQMVRKEWLNLNGLWDFALLAKDLPQPIKYQTQILVPFPVESALSGVMKPVSENQRLWYRRSFELPKSWSGRRVLLHFGAVDFEAQVWVNGKEVGTHRGGYDGFSFDITDALNRRGANELLVSAWDPTDAGTQPRGKQVRKPEGIWYTSTSGIWQTVWLEPVTAAHIESLELVPDIDKHRLTVRALTATRAANFEIEAVARDRSGVVATGTAGPGQDLQLTIRDPKLWSPDSPFLYDLVVRLKLGGHTLDSVESYFGMRKISLGKDEHNFTRLMLNNKPVFQFGPLDQGFWPDGLYTAPTDEALRYDIEMTRKLGFNLARKHVKIEPDRWYYWCDKLGLLVWQDMPSGDKYIGGRDADITRTPESAAEFETELTAMIKGRGTHPCIVMWVPYNEGWGQWDTPRIVDFVKRLDPSRLVNNASGWTDRGVGDVNDMHNYPGPGSPNPEPKRAAVLGEFGGLGLPLPGYTWQSDRNWGYRSFSDHTKLTRAYCDLAGRLFPLIRHKGLSAAVYTQTTDVEGEVNGLMTYDRELVKVDMAKAAAANRGEGEPPLETHEAVPTARKEAAIWRYTVEQPGQDWMKPEFSSATWKEGRGGFGSAGTPGALIGTTWHTQNIWLRREFALNGSSGKDIQLALHHDEDAEVFVNGILALKVDGYTSDYDLFDLNPAARASLKPSGNLLAIHCRQTAGGQYIDAGLVTTQPSHK